jgi:hypothetical protein
MFFPVLLALYPAYSCRFFVELFIIVIARITGYPAIPFIPELSPLQLTLRGKDFVDLTSTLSKIHGKVVAIVPDGFLEGVLKALPLAETSSTFSAIIDLAATLSLPALIDGALLELFAVHLDG